LVQYWTGRATFEAAELPDPLDAEILAQGGNWVLQTQLGRFDIMQWIGDAELWDRLCPAALEVEMEGMQVMVVGYDDLVALEEGGRSAERPRGSRSPAPGARGITGQRPARISGQRSGRAGAEIFAGIAPLR